mgnify:CR=1 FL=1
MKQVLLIDSTPAVLDFFKEKLSIQQITIESAKSGRDAYTKLISILPDLVLIDTPKDMTSVHEFLDKKINDPNAHSIPTIIMGESDDRLQITQLSAYGVHKYFPKPIKVDQLFNAIGHAMHLNFSADPTPCIMEMHLTDNIFFIEIADGLNRDKIALLKYKLSHIINDYSLAKPKLVLMLSGMELSFVDTSNIVYLMDNILGNTHIKHENVKVLSTSNFVAELIKGHSEYEDVEVTNDIQTVLNPLIEHFAQTTPEDVIIERLLTPNKTLTQRHIDIRFSTDYDGTAMGPYDNGSILNVAIVDDDIISQKILENTFKRVEAETFTFASGVEFINSVASHHYDFVILDIFIPDMNGLDILHNLQHQNFERPILVYSQATNKNFVIQALSLGAKNYLVKPQKPDVILRTVFETLRSQL